MPQTEDMMSQKLRTVSLTIGIIMTVLAVLWPFALEPRVVVVSRTEAEKVEARINTLNEHEHAAIQRLGEQREDRIMKAIAEINANQRETQRLLQQLILEKKEGKKP